MNFFKQRPGLRIVSVSATSLLCILLAGITPQKASSNGLLKKKPSVVLQASTTSITYPCPLDSLSNSGSCPSPADFQVTLTATGKDFNKQTLYDYTVAGGQVVGEGSRVTWDLSGVGPGTYTATVEVQDNKKHRALSSVTVKVMNCPDCVISCFLCPIIMVTCYDEVTAGTLATCKVVVSGPVDVGKISWTAQDSSGLDLSERISGQGAYISIRTGGLGGQTITATVEIKGLDLSCGRTAAHSIKVKP